MGRAIAEWLDLGCDVKGGSDFADYAATSLRQENLCPESATGSN